MLIPAWAIYVIVYFLIGFALSNILSLEMPEGMRMTDRMGGPDLHAEEALIKLAKITVVFCWPLYLLVFAAAFLVSYF